MTQRQAVAWQLGWTALALVAGAVIWAISGATDAETYVTVYVIERSLSLDNVFVFLMVFASFGVPAARRKRLLEAGIALALVMRGVAILAGTELIEHFHWVLYVLGGTLVVLAWRMYRGHDAERDPAENPVVRFARRRGGRWATPTALCLIAIVVTDIIFAVDSVPAAFAITQEPLLIWLGNLFALLGLGSMFVLVEGLIARFRFMSQTIAIVLGFVGLKLVFAEWVHLSTAVSLGAVVAILATGMLLSLARPMNNLSALDGPPTPDPRDGGDDARRDSGLGENGTGADTGEAEHRLHPHR